MNKIRNSYSFIPFYSYFMDYAPVKEIVDGEGADGLGAVTALLLQLLKFRGGIASLTDLKTLAVPLRKRKAYLLHIVTDYRMFRVTPDGQSFYSPYLREVMKLVLEIETADDYYQSTNNRQTWHDNAPSKAPKRVGKSFANEYRKNESADNQAVSEPNDDNMYNKDNKNNKDYYNKKTPSTTTKKKKKKEEEKEEFFYEKNNFYNDSAKKRVRREYSDEEPSYTDRESDSGKYSDGEPHYADRQRSGGEPPTDSGQRGNGTYSRRDDEPPFDAIVRSAGSGRQRSCGEQPTDYGHRGEAASERREGEARRRLPEKEDRIFADAEWLRDIYEQGHTPLCWQKGRSTPESFAHCMEHIKRWFVQQVVCKGDLADSPQRLRYYFFNLMNPGSKTREECRHYVSNILQRERSLAAEGKTANDGYGYGY